MALVSKIDWAMVEGLLPVIVQSSQDNEVLTHGYMNERALIHTLDTGRVTFFCRKRRTLWTKGSEEGHFFQVKEVLLDSDQDTLLIRVDPSGTIRHKDSLSCFKKQPTPINCCDIAAPTFSTLAEGQHLTRAPLPPKSSCQGNSFAYVVSQNAAADERNPPYISKLENIIEAGIQSKQGSKQAYRFYSQGKQRLAQKLGEKAVGLAVAGALSDTTKLLEGSADLVFHLLVLLKAHDVKYQDVIEVLKKRESICNDPENTPDDNES